MALLKKLGKRPKTSNAAPTAVFRIIAAART
jgi:hypothetical protein